MGGNTFPISNTCFLCRCPNDLRQRHVPLRKDLSDNRLPALPGKNGIGIAHPGESAGGETVQKCLPPRIMCLFR